MRISEWSSDVCSSDLAIADLAGALDALAIERAHLVGLSMGTYTGLRFALAHPGRVLSLVAASGGSGGHPPTRERFITDTRALSAPILKRSDARRVGKRGGVSCRFRRGPHPYKQ